MGSFMQRFFPRIKEELLWVEYQRMDTEEEKIKDKEMRELQKRVTKHYIKEQRKHAKALKAALTPKSKATPLKKFLNLIVREKVKKD